MLGTIPLVKKKKNYLEHVLQIVECVECFLSIPFPIPPEDI
jgi:hypothetical protein